MPTPVTVATIDLVTDETLAELRTHHADACVSIFLPTHEAGTATQQDPIRLANLLREAETLLADQHGRRRPEIEELLSPARALLDDREFWRFQGRGLAVYLAPGTLRTIRAAQPFEERVVVAGGFRLRPLLPHVSHDDHFFVLALSQNEVRLFEGTRFTMATLPLGEIPADMAEALAHEDPEAQLQVRSGGQAGMYHGHGPGDEADKATLERYFRAVDRPLRARVGTDRRPLVLASVAYYLPIYRSVTSYPALADQGVTGNPEGLNPAEVHERAWPIVEPVLAAARDEAQASLHAATGSGRAAVGPQDVVTAALAGRVSALFLADDRPVWGRTDGEGVVVHTDREAGDEDLLELAALTTIGGGGRIHLDTDLPVGTHAAALLRW